MPYPVLQFRPRHLPVALLLSVVGCGDGFTTEVTNREPLTPLPVYEEWWAATEACSGLSGDLRAVEWFTASGIVSDGTLAFGMWTPPHRITLVKGYEENEFIVRHEMLHDLLRGDSDHASTDWTTCALLPDDGTAGD